MSSIHTMLTRKNWASNKNEKRRKLIIVMIIVVLTGLLLLLIQRSSFNSYTSIDSISFYSDLFENVNNSKSLQLNENDDDGDDVYEDDEEQSNESNIHVIISAGCNALQDCKC
jgi:hypothetical protein